MADACLRLARTDAAQPEPLAVNADLTHDTQTPVLVGDRLLAVSHGLHCLDADTLQIDLDVRRPGLP